MNLLPRLLYLFISLPVVIPDSQFAKWDKQVSRFVWKEAKARIRFKTLQLAKLKGGFALPNFKEYFLAAQLRYIVYWCSPKYYSKWKQIEINYIPSSPPQSRLGDKNSTQLKEGSPIVETTIKLWWDTVKKF